MARWWFRAVNTTAWSEDELFSRQDFNRIPELCRLIAGLHVSHIAVSQPMYLASDWTLAGRQAPKPGWTEQWVRSIRATGKNIFWRGSFVSFKGWYGVPKLTARTTPARPATTPGGWRAVVNGQDTTSYVALAYHYILGHPSWFQNGDIWGVFGECEYDGIGDGTADQFRDNAEFNQFLRDLTISCRQAFKKIGKRVLVGMNANDVLQSYGYNAGYLDPQTAKLVGIISLDRYEQQPEFLLPVISAFRDTYGLPIVSSEWGPMSNGKQPLTNDTINTMFHALAQVPYYQGMGVWEAVDPYKNNSLFDPKSLTPLPQAKLVGEWFDKMKPTNSLPMVLLAAGVGTALAISH